MIGSKRKIKVIKNLMNQRQKRKGVPPKHKKQKEAWEEK